MDMIGAARVTHAAGVPIAWGELGAGEPLVLLHGLGDSHRTWRRVAHRLANRYRVLMPDLPGHGLSGRPDASYTIEWYAQTMSAWMENVGAARAHVVGHSFGGGVAQWMVLEHRARIDRLALVAAGGLGREVGIGLRLAAFPVLGRILAPPLMRAGTQIMMRVASGLFGAPEPEEIDRLAWMNAAPGTGRAFHRTTSGCIDLFGQYMQTEQRITEITELPRLALFWGDRDPILPILHGDRAQERLEHVTLARYPQVGHFPHLEAHERFAEDLQGFLVDDERPCARVRAVPVGVDLKKPKGRIRRAFATFFRDVAAAFRTALRAIDDEPITKCGDARTDEGHAAARPAGVAAAPAVA